MSFIPTYFDLTGFANNPNFNLNGSFSSTPTIPNSYNWGNSAVPNQLITEAQPKAKSGIGLYVFQQLLTYGPSFIAAFKGNRTVDQAQADILAGNVNQSQIEEYLKKYPTGDPNAAPRSASILGIPTSTLLLVALVFIGYLTFFKKENKPYRRL
jgi:hypothetical protein